MQTALYTHASQDLIENKSMAENGDTSAQTLFHSRESAEAEAKAKAAEYAKARMVEDAKTKAAEEAKTITQLKAIENTNNLKYSGGLSEALQNNKDKGLDWFKNKLFKLDKASVITMCDPGICYVVAFSGLSGLGITSENGDFNGRQLQGQLVRVIGTDRFGNIVVTRLTTNDKPSQKSRPNTQEKPAQQPSLASPATSNYAEIVNSIDDLIIERVVENWARPPSARNGMVVVVQVEMVQDGTMRSVNVAKSSGDVPYDNSVVAAVKSIGRLSEMQELKPSDFQPYRSFKLTFSPEDLAL
jgi:TonB family protein